MHSLCEKAGQPGSKKRLLRSTSVLGLFGAVRCVSETTALFLLRAVWLSPHPMHVNSFLSLLYVNTTQVAGLSIISFRCSLAFARQVYRSAMSTLQKRAKVADVKAQTAFYHPRLSWWILLGLTAVGLLLWMWLRPQPKLPELSSYTPREALLFVEAGSLPAGLHRLTALSFWKDIEAAIGAPAQLHDVLLVGRIVECLNLGPAEARLLARARWGLIVTDLTAEVTPPTVVAASSGAKQDQDEKPAALPSGAVLNLTPRLTLCVATGLSSQELTELAGKWLPLVARKLLGQESQCSELVDEAGQKRCFRHPARPEAALWAATRGELLFLANHEAALQACLDVADGRRSALAGSPAFEEARQFVDGQRSWLFAFINPSGLEVALRLTQGLPSPNDTVSTNDEQQSFLQALLTGISDGLGYSLDVYGGQVVERYYLTLRPSIATALREHLRPVSFSSDMERFFLPTGELTVVGLSQPLTALDRMQTALAARSSAAVAFLSRELVAGLRERYGLRPHETLDECLGEQWLVINPGGEAPALIFGVPVRNRAQLLPPLEHYLRADGANIIHSTLGKDILLAASTHHDKRAACFLDNWLFVGNRHTLEYLFTQTVPKWPSHALQPKQYGAPEAFLQHIAHRRDDLERATLVLIALTRAGEPIPSRLKEPPIRHAIERQPLATGYLRLRGDGCFGETRSPLGSLAYLASLLSGNYGS
jgi:hypothetical protein